ncbi:25S rRNA (adenine2142-N1)-methyltransferase [Entomophthora muscae]|uniref:25S rRNA (Adenine2142-N1)-methyltransferase n=1 Tax=Entomophthora muscae TaxID=34485 RepID=A0ACC2RM39_9FUNG|nr:25S rRNA (adenine2142-N1)-methyltransferase [Entomophthora muscae]
MICKSFSLLKSRLPNSNEEGTESDGSLGGYLYVVMPLPCISNSRYMNEDHYCKIFQASGFKLMASKSSPKLAFHIFRRLTSPPPKASFPKSKLRDGPALNNFTIVL